jgi:hypothetical protein
LPTWSPTSTRPRERGIADEDILHVYRNPIRVFTDQGDWELTTHIGLAADGVTLLEGGFATSDDGKVVIVHAMTTRPKYLK